MKIDRTIVIAAAAGLIGLLLGYLMGGAGSSDLEAQLAERGALDEGVAALSERTGALDEGVAALSETTGAIDKGVGALSETVGAIEARLGAVEGKLAELGDSHASGMGGLAERVDAVGASIAVVGSEVSGALSADLAELRDKVAALAIPQGTAPGADPAGPGEEVKIGDSIGFGDGAARVFLSSVDAAAGTARVAINGPMPSTIALGIPTQAGDCSVTLTGFVLGGATVSGECGGSGSAAAVPQGSGEGTGVAVGATGMLADGKIRLFVSAIDPASGTARVAINGTKVAELTMSEPVEAGDCTVILTGLGEGEATIDAAC